MDAQDHLADELKLLVGWSASPRRVAALQVLVRTAGSEGEPARVAGFATRRFLIDAIASFDEPVEIAGVVASPEAARVAFRLLLGIEGSHLSAPGRRSRAIQKLGIERVTVDQWRRPFGLERECLGFLAAHLAAREREPSVK